MALRPIDKKVVKAFLDGQPADGRILTSNGEKLQTTGYVGSGAVIAEWVGDKVSILDEYSNHTEQSAANYMRKATPRNKQTSHSLYERKQAASRVVLARKKKNAQQRERQPGQVSSTLRRRLGDALADIFDQYGPEIYSETVLALKDVILSKFKDGFEALDDTVKDELGRRGVEESRHHIRSWANEIVEDVNHMGLDEVAGALEDYVGTLTAEYQQPEEGEEILEVEEEELEPVEVVEEEEVEPEEGEEVTLEEMELEVPGEEEAAASFGPTGGRRRRPRPRLHRRHATNSNRWIKYRADDHDR